MDVKVDGKWQFSLSGIGYVAIVTVTLEHGECDLGAAVVTAIAAEVGPKLSAIPYAGPVVSALVVAQLAANAADIKKKDLGQGVLVIVHAPVMVGMPYTEVQSRSVSVRGATGAVPSRPLPDKERSTPTGRATP